ncbi:MAG: hypothetical protein AMXMBFR64_13240 [Myxococcales bacterium]
MARGARHAPTRDLARYSRQPARILPGNRVTVIHDGPHAIPAMLGAIDAARHSVHVEAYILRSDSVGWRLAEALVAAVRRGATVRLTYDSAGCIATDVSLFDHLERYGVQVLEFRPIAPWRPRWSWNNRNHRKLLIIDGEVGFCTGLNWGEEYYALDAAGQSLWRDTTARIEGPAVRELQRLFLRCWWRHHDKQRAVGHVDTPRPRGTSAVEVVGTWSARTGGRIRRAYLHAFRRARRTIYVANAYFLPDRGLVRALANAVRRGVDVRVVVPGETDVAAMYYGSRATFGRLLRSGVRLFEWSGTMLHSKTCVVDGGWVTIGSANLDPRSRFHNQEANVIVYDERIGRAMERTFVEDLSRATEVRQADWQKRGLWQRLLERLFYAVRYWL